MGTTPKVKKVLDKSDRKRYTNKADSRGTSTKQTELKANTWSVASRAVKKDFEKIKKVLDKLKRKCYNKKVPQRTGTKKKFKKFQKST